MLLWCFLVQYKRLCSIFKNVTHSFLKINKIFEKIILGLLFVVLMLVAAVFLFAGYSVFAIILIIKILFELLSIAFELIFDKNKL